MHCDVKPENVLLDADGYIKITDFGLSKQGMSTVRRTYSYCGTPEYIAPEIIQGIGHDKAADWWSLVSTKSINFAECLQLSRVRSSMKCFAEDLRTIRRTASR